MGAKEDAITNDLAGQYVETLTNEIKSLDRELARAYKKLREKNETIAELVRLLELSRELEEPR
jgi:hypothetical protein